MVVETLKQAPGYQMNSAKFAAAMYTNLGGKLGFMQRHGNIRKFAVEEVGHLVDVRDIHGQFIVDVRDMHGQFTVQLKPQTTGKSPGNLTVTIKSTGGVSDGHNQKHRRMYVYYVYVCH